MWPTTCRPVLTGCAIAHAPYRRAITARPCKAHFKSPAKDSVDEADALIEIKTVFKVRGGVV